MLYFVLLVTAFGVVNSLTVVIVRGHGSVALFSSLNTSCDRLHRLFATANFTVSLIKATVKAVVNVTVIALRTRFKLVHLKDKFVASICPISLRLFSVVYIILVILPVNSLTALCAMEDRVGGRGRRVWNSVRATRRAIYSSHLRQPCGNTKGRPVTQATSAKNQQKNSSESSCRPRVDQRLRPRVVRGR